MESMEQAHLRIRERLRAIDPAQVKRMLLSHVRNCTSINCATCQKLRQRVWARANPLHAELTNIPGLLHAKPAELLRAGEDIHRSLERPAHLSGVWPASKMTPVALAQALHAKGEAPQGSAAWLVLRASEPWSADTHHLFSAPKRERAVLLVRIGFALSRSGRFTGEEASLMDCWREFVMPHAIGPGGCP